MKRYKATVNAAGMWVETILYAQNQAQAYALFKAIFGVSNVPHQPQQIG
jgi:glycerol-3-phosphate dehydrogenase